MDKIEKIKAEIERLKTDIGTWAEYNEGWRDALERIAAFIKSLPEEPVSEDLEKTSKEYADKNYVEWLDFVSGDERDDHYPISEAFKAGAKWQKRIDDIIKRNIHNNAVKYGKRQIINAACEYLWRQMWPDNKIDDFRKELEEG